MSQDRNDAIVKKIKGLLAIAKDKKNDEESQSAFVMAQKLMMKYNISIGEVESQQDGMAIKNGHATVYKRLAWWETQLASIIAKNFRVKFYYNNDRSGRTVKRAIVFLGFEKDVKLAREMYILAYDVIDFYTKKYVKMYYEARPSQTRNMTTELKNSYMRGFLAGLDDKFEQQVAEMEQEWGLMVLVPQEVEKEYDKMFGDKKGLSFNIPSAQVTQAYSSGYRQGNNVDYTKTTIGEGV